MEEFVDWYEVLGGSAGPDTPIDEIKDIYHSLLLNCRTPRSPRHPDKRPNSASGEGRKKTVLLNTAWDKLKTPDQREAYNVEWRKRRYEKMLPFERADDRRKKGNDAYRMAQAVMRSGSTFEAATQYAGAIEAYTEGINEKTNDHRLYSNRALCYAALQEWQKAKMDSLECIKIRPDFMKGWFTLCRSYMMNNESRVAMSEMENAFKACNRHPDLVKLHEEIRLSLGDRDQKDPLGRRTSRTPINVSPACTPPSPCRPVNPLVQAGQWGVDLEQTSPFEKTAQFGLNPPMNFDANASLDGTANFGARSRSITPPRFRVNPPPGSGTPPPKKFSELASGAATVPPPQPGIVPQVASTMAAAPPGILKTTGNYYSSLGATYTPPLPFRAQHPKKAMGVSYGMGGLSYVGGSSTPPPPSLYTQGTTPRMGGTAFSNKTTRTTPGPGPGLPSLGHHAKPKSLGPSLGQMARKSAAMKCNMTLSSWPKARSEELQQTQGSTTSTTLGSAVEPVQEQAGFPMNFKK